MTKSNNTRRKKKKKKSKKRQNPAHLTCTLAVNMLSVPDFISQTCCRNSVSSLFVRVPQQQLCPLVKSANHQSRKQQIGIVQAEPQQFKLTQQDWIERLKLHHQSIDQQECEVKGSVYLVGTGPGDPGLLTLKALQLMQTADVILYDRLVSDEILKLVHEGALMVYVGKQKGFHTRTQDEIHQLLVEFATQGKTVLRLKGGDPFVFGRGGEEAEYLQQRNIDVHIIPGITAAMGISSELGIPLTHRGVATSVRFLTGHSREGGELQLDQTITCSGGDESTTLVVYMGLNTLESLVTNLERAGMEASTPVVAVERGTTPQQRAVFGRLSSISAFVKEQNLSSPTLIIVGLVEYTYIDNMTMQRCAVSKLPNPLIMRT
eukprot:TRINITY_DN23572_c0_g1_i3.p1 TRINITY_DN23572_c0_g1~~TRINITY_DN23572_c0_g1_i3.p1  ORF type:complete len:404 (-),score=31.57 TRINITY_DN23572_c0_g1_i3:29-1156(-)